jgi:NADH dehydrogenase
VILVAGGTGCLGREIVALLLARGERVRVLTRTASRAPADVEVAIGDVRDRAAVAAATNGVRAVVSAVHGFAGANVDPESVDRDGNANLVEAAGASGVAHFVLLSVHGASAEHPIELFRMKHAAEQTLRASDLSWTILRPTAFLETWLGILGAPLLRSGKTTVFGRGENPINFVSARDVARYVDHALQDPSLRGRVVDVAGPENLTFHELLARFETVTGARGKRSHVPLPVMRAAAVLMKPIKPSLARQIRAGVVMDTTDMTCNVAPVLAPTSVADAIRRAYG